MSPLKRLLDEIHGRSLWQVLGIYVAGGWLVLQVIDQLVQQLLLPAWVYRGTLILLLLGLPLVLVTAFVQKGIRSASPADAVGVRRLFTWRNAVLAGVLGFAALGAGTTAVLLMRTLGMGRPLAASEQPIGLAVFPFRGVGPEASTLGEGFGDLIAAAIDGTGGMRVADPNGVWLSLRRDEDGGLIAPELDDALELTRRSSSAAALLGSVTAAGSRLNVTARLYEPDGGLQASFTESVAADSLYPAVNRLAIQVVAELWERDSLPSVPSIEALATNSAEALQEYLDAVRLRRLGQYEMAQTALERAIERDSTFALAYLELFTVRSWILYLNAQPFVGLREIIDKAMEHRDRLSTRNQARIEAHRALDETDGATAATALGRIIEIDSLDIDAVETLAFTYLRDGWQIDRELDDIVAAYDRAIAVDPSSVSARERRAWIPAFTLATREALEQAIARLSALDTTRVTVRGNLLAFRAASLEPFEWRPALRAAAQEPMPVITSVLRALRAVRPTAAETFLAELAADSMPVQHQRVATGARFQLWMAQGKLAACDSLIRAGGLERIRSVTNTFLVSSLLAGAPDSTAAGRAVDELVAYAPADSLTDYLESRNVWGTGWAVAAYNATLGDTLLARAYQRGLLALPEGDAPMPDWRGSLGADIEARLAARRGDLGTAEEEARKAYERWGIHSGNVNGSHPEPAMRFHLAELLETRGAVDEAASLYRSHLPPHTWRDFYTALSYERLGGIYDRAGDLEKAAQYYARFIELWSDADPQLQPRVDAARARLEEILAERA